MVFERSAINNMYARDVTPATYAGAARTAGMKTRVFGLAAAFVAVSASLIVVPALLSGSPAYTGAPPPPQKPHGGAVPFAPTIGAPESPAALPLPGHDPDVGRATPSVDIEGLTSLYSVHATADTSFVVNVAHWFVVMDLPAMPNLLAGTSILNEPLVTKPTCADVTSKHLGQHPDLQARRKQYYVPFLLCLTLFFAVGAQVVVLAVFGVRRMTAPSGHSAQAHEHDRLIQSEPGDVVEDKWAVGTDFSIASSILFFLVCWWNTFLSCIYEELSAVTGLPWEMWAALVTFNGVDVIFQAVVRGLTAPHGLAISNLMIFKHVVLMNTPMLSMRIDTMKDCVFIFLCVGAGNYVLAILATCVLVGTQARSWGSPRLYRELRHDQLPILRPTFPRPVMKNTAAVATIRETAVEAANADATSPETTVAWAMRILTKQADRAMNFISELAKETSGPLKQEFAVLEDIPQAILLLCFVMGADSLSGFVVTSFIMAFTKAAAVPFIAFKLKKFGRASDHISCLMGSPFAVLRRSAAEALLDMGPGAGPEVGESLAEALEAEVTNSHEASWIFRALMQVLDMSILVNRADVRKTVAEGLGNFRWSVADRPQRNQAVRALIKALLSDTDKHVIMAAAEALGKLQATEAWQELTHATMSDGNAGTRATAARALSAIDSQKAWKEMMHAALTHPGANHRTNAVLGLRIIDGKQAWKEVMHAALTHPDANHRTNAVLGLRIIDGKQAWKEMMHAALTHRDANHRTNAVLGLRSIDGKEAWKEMMHAALTHPDANHRTNAVLGLRIIDGKQAWKEMMHAALTHRDANHRTNAVLGLSSIDGKQAWKEIMHAALTHPDANHLTNAVLGLSSIDGKQAWKEMMDAAVRAPHVKQNALLVALRTLDAKKTAADIEREVQKAEVQRDKEAKLHIAKMGKRDSNVRINAARALGDLGGRKALQACKKALESDTDTYVRRGAAEALGKIGDPEALQPLIKALESDTDTYVRRGAAEALGKIGEPEALQPLIKALASDSWYFVRREAATALDKIGDPEALQPLIKALESDDTYSVRRAAAIALGNIGGPEAITALKAAKGDSHASVKEGVADALSKLGA